MGLLNRLGMVRTSSSALFLVPAQSGFQQILANTKTDVKKTADHWLECRCRSTNYGNSGKVIWIRLTDLLEEWCKQLRYTEVCYSCMPTGCLGATDNEQLISCAHCWKNSSKNNNSDMLSAGDFIINEFFFPVRSDRAWAQTVLWCLWGLMRKRVGTFSTVECCVFKVVNKTWKHLAHLCICRSPAAGWSGAVSRC